jgi:diguanylate cyclase (GGDEF)-like protein
MQSAVDIFQDKLKLLSSAKLEEACDIISQIVLRVTNAKAMALLLWDPDLEEVSDRLVTGAKKMNLQAFADSFSESDAEGEIVLEELEDDELTSLDDEDLLPVFCFRLRQDDELTAVVLIAGSDSSQKEEWQKLLLEYPFALVLARAFEYRELNRENQRLRTRYEELEDRIISMEEQTRKLIHDVMAKDSLRTKQVDRERLVFGISNAVRSSIEIEKVLQRAVDDIGTTLQVSRCLVLRTPDLGQNVDAYEYHDPVVSSIKEHFGTDEGLTFMRTALSKQAPQDLMESDADTAGPYEATFIRKLDYRSGLIVPLVIRDEVLGIVFLHDCLQARQWSIDDISLLGALADQMSVGIENAQLHAEKKRQAVIDELTGVANRRRFMEVYQLEFERAKRYNEPLSLVIVDLDFLKKVNDTYGHQAGDEAIKTIGRLLKQSSRNVDLPARYGGEEFCLLLPNTDLAMAEQIAERLRKLIYETPVAGPGTISASIGVACYPVHADNPETLFEKADTALYQAKGGGRNRVCLATDVVEPKQ